MTVRMRLSGALFKSIPYRVAISLLTNRPLQIVENAYRRPDPYENAVIINHAAVRISHQGSQYASLTLKFMGKRRFHNATFQRISISKRLSISYH